MGKQSFWDLDLEIGFESIALTGWVEFRSGIEKLG
jgi:hypothetical protein